MDLLYLTSQNNSPFEFTSLSPERILCSLNPYVPLIEGAVILCSIKLSDIHFMLSSMVNVHSAVC